MLLQTLLLFQGCLLAVECREANKIYRSIPPMTASLVNYGKLDIAFHFNYKDTPPNSGIPSSTLNSFLLPQSEPTIEEPCPCSSLRGIKNNFINSPSDIIKKILSSSDLFSFNKQPTTSTFCCESHELTQEDTITIEMPSNPRVSLPKLPFIYENMLSKTGMSPMSSMLPMSEYPKPVEILFFPKNRESSLFSPMKKDFKKEAIQIVGDKEMKNKSKKAKYRPTNLFEPINIQSSVKKDLTAQEKSETNKDLEKKVEGKGREEVDVTTVKSLNAF